MLVGRQWNSGFGNQGDKGFKVFCISIYLHGFNSSLRR